MEPPCLKEATQLCLNGWCPVPLIGIPEPLNKPEKARNTAARCRRNFTAATAASIFPNTQFTNHECLPSLESSFNNFSKAYPQYSATFQVDQIRAQEYYFLSVSNHTCLDYIGIGLFSHTQLHVHGLRPEISSPNSPPSSLRIRHSHVPFFSAAYKTGNLKTRLRHGGEDSELESAMKRRIMNFLKISADDYCMVFTANRTSAFKLVAESYPYNSSNKLLTVYDYESEAVETMIKSSEKRGAKVMSAEFSWPRLRIQGKKLWNMIVRTRKSNKKRGLFVFPLHSRMTGARYPYLWMKTAQENGWHTLIDACALGAKDMDSFGLSILRPDFLICSFYKIYAENPSGFACLFVKKSIVPILEDSLGTGMVSLISAERVLGLMDNLSGTGSQPEEDELDTSSSFSGSISNHITNTANLDQGPTSKIRVAENPAKGGKSKANRSFEVECRGLDHVDMLGLVQISNRSRCLINWLVKALMKLRHPNRDGNRLIRIYGPKVKFDRGPALAFNVFDWKGEKIEANLVQKLAGRSNIYLSNGFLQNITFSDEDEEAKANVLEKRSDGANGNGKSKRKDKNSVRISVVTAAFGFLADFEDAYRLWAFLAQFLDADFVEKAKWRYAALDQTTIEV